ncbi:phenylalanine--tRNA ligase subunit beta [Eupransor demetentiae]|uniref:Phenylalanine--tRNA ligase beta subunit n=1 Tax=Eupransor demetentiae TaxID=3109584 RepID=A0ABP0EQS9_9LACO|nr:Phenylalanyl-tRNA synthetase beta subunit (PheT) [Lactobacillaceae bacterium LMG 33000]
MNTNLAWLNEYLNQDLDLSQAAVIALGERLERTSVEVDSVFNLAQGQDGLVVAKVLSVKEHPDSDHMVITQVDAGESEPIQIVTGAPNVAEGQLVILAKVGAHIIDRESGKLVKIKKAKLRGEESYGMLSALQEIGFDNKIAPDPIEKGIYVFDPKSGVQPGDDALEALGMLDPIIDTDLTPNRTDMLSMRGVAYELAAILDCQATMPTFQLSEGSQKSADLIQAEVTDEKLADQFGLRVIDNVQVGPSPLWLQRRLWNAGVKPVNNLVDVTNYLMVLFGQPLHVYDYDRLPEKKLTVRLAKDGEKFTGLDEQEYELRPNQDIVISSGDQVLNLAGVLGGQAAEVTEKTKRVVIESASFNPSLVRAAARRHTLHTGASSRFERGIDPSQVESVLDQAAALLADLAKGQVAKDAVYGARHAYQARQVEISVDRINQILGTDLQADEIASIFKRLAFEFENKDGNFIVAIPGRRPDISIPADLIEEVARLHGYDNLPTAYITGQTTPGKLTSRQRQIRASRRVMESLGLNQAISYALTTPEKATRFNANKAAKLVTLDYPMSSDRTTARQNLLSGLLDDVAYNVARSVHDIALYEQGRVFLAKGEKEQPAEIEHLAGVLTGSLVRSSWENSRNVKEVDFYDLKGIVEKYLAEIGMPAVRFEATDRHEAMHPGQTADIYGGDHYLGFVGQIHPAFLQKEKLPQVFGFELDLQSIIDYSQRGQNYEVISRYPQVSRDLAILVDEKVTNADIQNAIEKTAGQHLVESKVFDVFTGGKLPAGKKSLAYQLTYQDKNDTLLEADVNDDVEKIVTVLQQEFNAEIR